MEKQFVDNDQKNEKSENEGDKLRGSTTDRNAKNNLRSEQNHEREMKASSDYVESASDNLRAADMKRSRDKAREFQENQET